MKLYFVMLDNNEVSALRTPMYALITLKCIRSDIFIDSGLMNIEPLEIHFFASLEQELISLGI
jgi:hypothetical protein